MFVYADNAATTKMSKTAIDAMLPYLDTWYGNASSLYAFGQKSAVSETVPPPNRSHLPTTQTLAVCGRSNRPFAYSFAPPER